MEDPWGSPWATTDAPTPKIDLPAAPPTAHFSIESTSNSQKTVQNPWEDGDAWGGWNDAAASTPGAAPVAGGVARKRSGVFDSPGWGGLSPAAHPAKVPTPRGVSPDPWRLSDGRMSDGRRSVSRERSLQDLKRKSDASLGMGSEGPETDRLSAGNAFGLQNVWGPRQNADGHAFDRVSVDGKAAGPDHQPEPSIAISAEMAPVCLGTTPVSRSESPSVLSEESPTTSEAQSISRPESPTGVPPGPAIPTVADDQGPDQNRKASNKVQELVEMYDGISQNASPSIGATSPRTPTGISMTAILSNPKLQAAERSSESDEPSGNETATQFEEEVQQTEDTEASEPLAIHPETSPANEKAFESSLAPQSESKQYSKIQPIEFQVDMTNLDDLFPSTPPTKVEPAQVPDVIIDDSFTSISERKTWYRISRLGAMRMHQMGDVENYVRVDWKRSAARQDTLKIVRRWMEEESGGRPTLGRKVGAIGGSVFNWNSSAPPVEIGELLRKRGGHSKGGSSASRTSGILSPATPDFGWGTPPVSPAVSNRPPPSPVARTSEAAARVSTSARPQSLVLPRAPPPPSPITETDESRARPGASPRPQSMILARAPPPPSDSSREFGDPPKLQPVPIITRSIDVAIQPSIEQTLVKQVPAPIVVNGSKASFSDDKGTSDEDDEEDDDDWGDMVTSPTTATSPYPTVAATHTWPVAGVKVSTNMEESKKFPEESKDEIVSPGVWPSAPAETSPWPTGAFKHSWPVEEKTVLTNIEDTEKLPEDTNLDEKKEEIVSPGVWPSAPSQKEDDPPPSTFADMGLLPAGAGMVAPQHPLSVTIENPKPPLAPLSLASAMAWTEEPSGSKALSPLLVGSPSPTVSLESPLDAVQTEPTQINLAEEEEAATSILTSLPDLTYMLR